MLSVVSAIIPMFLRLAMKPTTTTGWLARILGVLMFAFLLSFTLRGSALFGGEFVPTNRDALMVVTMLAAAIGIIVGFYRELAGGMTAIVATFGYFAFCVFVGFGAPIMPDIYELGFGLILLPATLFVISGVELMIARNNQLDVSAAPESDGDPALTERANCDRSN